MKRLIAATFVLSLAISFSSSCKSWKNIPDNSTDFKASTYLPTKEPSELQLITKSDSNSSIITSSRPHIIKTTIKDTKSLKYNISSILKGHQSYILALLVLKNDLLASASDDHTIRIWNLTNKINPTEKYVLRGHTATVKSLVALNDYYLASSSWDQTIKIWDLRFGTLFKSLVQINEPVFCIVKLTDETLASGSHGTSIKIWNITEERVIRYLENENNDTNIHDFKVLQSGLLASASDDYLVRIFNVTDGNLVIKLSGHKSTVSSLIVLANTDLVSGSWDSSIKIWNTTTWILKMTLNTKGRVNYLSILNKDFLITIADYLTVKIWDYSKEDEELYSFESYSIFCLEPLVNNFLALGTNFDEIFVLNVEF